MYAETIAVMAAAIYAGRRAMTIDEAITKAEDIAAEVIARDAKAKEALASPVEATA